MPEVSKHIAEVWSVVQYKAQGDHYYCTEQITKLKYKGRIWPYSEMIYKVKLHICNLN